MGFTPSEAESALNANDGDLNRSIEYLFDRQGKKNLASGRESRRARGDSSSIEGAAEQTVLPGAEAVSGIDVGNISPSSYDSMLRDPSLLPVAAKLAPEDDESPELIKRIEQLEAQAPDVVDAKVTPMSTIRRRWICIGITLLIILVAVVIAVVVPLVTRGGGKTSDDFGPCGQALEDRAREHFNATQASISCSCSSSEAICTLTDPEPYCDFINCTVAQCIDPITASVNVCLQSQITSRISITNEFLNDSFFETSRAVTTYFPRGIANACVVTETYYFDNTAGDFPATRCSVEYDGVACASCTMCGTGDNTRIIDCSNIAPDAVDTDCVSETDHVDLQVLTFDANAECAPPA